MLDEYPYSCYFDEISEVFIVMDNGENIDKCETHEEAENFVAGLNMGYAQGRRDALAEIEARNNKREEL